MFRPIKKGELRKPQDIGIYLAAEATIFAPSKAILGGRF